MDNLTDLAAGLPTVWSQIETQLAAYPEIAGFGLMIAIAVALTLVFFFLSFMWTIARAAHIAGTAAEIRRGSDIGARILVARGVGKGGGGVSEFLSQTARTHLKRFMFGGPFDVIDFPASLPNRQRAVNLLGQAGADLVVWGEGRSGRKGPVVHIVRRMELSDRNVREYRSFELPAKRADWNDALAKATAYGLARALRPALGRPQDFRAERLAPVVETLEKILDDNPDLDPTLLADIVDDYAGGVLQLSLFEMEGWRDRSVDIMRDSLERMNRAKAPERWVTAKINLGRALQIRCQRNFDPLLLQEAIGHLTDALEALRTEPRFKIAESAAHSISECQKMLGTRRRFSITQGGL